MKNKDALYQLAITDHRRCRPCPVRHGRQCIGHQLRAIHRFQHLSGTAAPLTVATSIGPVTFTGGTVLTNTANLPANQTSLGGTANVLTGGIDPITITFAQPINDFFLNLHNGQAATQTYTIFDNAGRSTTVSLASNLSSGTSLISFPATGNIVTILSTGGTTFDVFIDDIVFNEATPGVPEPAGWAMMIAGVGAVGFATRRRRQVRARVAWG